MSKLQILIRSTHGMFRFQKSCKKNHRLPM